MAGPLIVLFGQDLRLVETRKWVLESAGHRVRTVATLDELERIAASDEVELILLCDSLPARLQTLASALLRTRWPTAPQLVLTPAFSQMEPGLEFATSFCAGEGPANVLATVHRLLACTSHKKPPQTTKIISQKELPLCAL